MKGTHRTTRRILGIMLILMLVLGALLIVPTPVLAQGPDAPPLPSIPPGQVPDNGPTGPGLPDAPAVPGEPVPYPAPTDDDCHIGNPNCEPARSFGIIPNLVQIWHDRPDGAPYRAYSRIRIHMSHNYGGYVYLYDWQPYMGQWPRLLGMYWLPAGYPRTITARVVPPYGPEWLTIYDPYSGAWDRTHFQVVP